MTAADILGDLLRINLAAGAAILGVILLRKAARRRFGARLAYGLWLLPVLAGAAVMIPARQVVVVRPAAAAVAPRVHQTIAMPGPALAPAPPPSAGLEPQVLLLGGWLAGAGVAALVMAGLQMRFLRKTRGGGAGPAVVGVIAPRIVTPSDFAHRYSRAEQALVLAHEQAHIARQDSRLNGLSAAAQCACWFNPLVHLAAHLMRMDQELACDEAVVMRFPGARRAYAEVLLKAQLAVLPLPLGCYWPSKTQHPLVERVAMLKRRDIGRARRMAGAAGLAALCAGSGLAAWAAQPADVRITVSPVHDAAALAPRSKASPSPTPPEPGAAPTGIVIKRVVIHGPEGIEQSELRSALAIVPGQTVTPATLNAALNKMMDRGRLAVTKAELQPSGDLVVWVTEKPPMQLIADRPPSPPSATLLNARWTGPVTGEPIQISGDRAERHDDQHLVRWTGRVEIVFGGNHLTSDVLEAYSPDEVSLVVGKAPSQNVPEVSQESWLKQMTADGHVSYLSDDNTVEADHAVYDLASGAITFTGNVVVAKGRGAVKDGKLVVQVKSGAAAQSGSSTENVLRRWIAAVQLHQTAEAVMSPSLIEAARRQEMATSQTFRAFGALQDVRFVRAMPEGVSNYEADFAHGKLNLMVGPLTADGKLDQLRWGPIWAKAGEPPQPGVPLAP